MLVSTPREPGREGDRRLVALVARLAYCATCGVSGLIFGGVGPLYFGSNAFLPGYFNEVGPQPT